MFYSACFEPALLDRSLQHEPGPRPRVGHGDYDSVIKTLTNALEHGPFLLGERFTVADVLWGLALSSATGFELMPESPLVRAYIDRVMAHPAIQRAITRDAAPMANSASA